MKDIAFELLIGETSSQLSIAEAHSNNGRKLGYGGYELRNTLVVVVVSVVAFTVVALLRKLLWQPLKMRRIMIKQGVAAAPFHFLVGSLPECFAYAAKFSGDLHVDDHYDSTPTVSPMNILYFPKNEKFFVYEWGSEPRLASRDPEFAKEVLLSSRAGDFGKARMNSIILEMVLGPDSLAVTQDVPRHDDDGFYGGRCVTHNPDVGGEGGARRSCRL